MEGFSTRGCSRLGSVWTQLRPALIVVSWVVLGFGQAAAEVTFRVGTYNLENYLLAESEGRPAKSPESRAKVREVIRALNADVLALQEIGGGAALTELRGALAAEGTRYDHAEIVTGHDPHISVALLSRFPIVARRPHPRESFLLLGRRFFVSRGFLEVDVQPAPGYQLTVFSAHLKSRRPTLAADEAELREQEARLLRERVESRMAADAKANVIVLGDLNDTKDSPALRALMGKGNLGLIDTRPAERGDRGRASGSAPDESRVVTWTHYYGKEDTYSRIDYLLISRGLQHEWVREATEVLVVPDWGLASDHRPLVATFRAEDRRSAPPARQRAVKKK